MEHPHGFLPEGRPGIPVARRELGADCRLGHLGTRALVALLGGGPGLPGPGDLGPGPEGIGLLAKRLKLTQTAFTTETQGLGREN